MTRFIILVQASAALAVLFAAGAAFGIPAPPFNWGTLAFAPDGRTLASARGSALDLWDVETGKLLRSWPAHRDGVTTLAYSPDGRVLASGGSDGALRLWDTRTGKLRATLQERAGAPWAVAFSPDGRTLVSADGTGGVTLWEARSGTPRRRLAVDSGRAAVAFSADGRVVATATGPPSGGVRLWDVRPGAEVRALKGGRELMSVGFSPDGKQVVAAGCGFVTLWDARTGEQHLTLRHPAAPCGACCTVDGAVVSAGGYQVMRWDVRTGKPRWSLEARGHVNAVAPSADGKRLAVGLWTSAGLDRGWEYEVCLLDAATGKEVRPFKR